MSDTQQPSQPQVGSDGLVRRRQDFDRAIVNAAIEDALTAIGKAKMKLPLNLARELQHAHDHLLNARDWVRIYSPNSQLTSPGTHILE